MAAFESHQERFSEMTRILFDDRSLQEQGGFNQTTTTTIAPSPSFSGDGNNYPSNGGDMIPTNPPAPTTNNNNETKSNFEKAQPLIFLVLILLLVFGIYKIYKTCQHRREQYLMRLRSVQADQVLGDMQMVPSEDPDAELL